MKYGIKLLAALLILTFSSHIRAQEEESEEEPLPALVIGGEITDDRDKTMKGVLVELYEGNEVVDSYETRRNGKFKFQLFSGHIYTIQLSKDGFLTKRISVNTTLPEDAEDSFTFNFDIGLVPEEGNRVEDETLYDYPSAIIEYNARKEEFYFDEKYTRSLMKDIRASTVR